MLDWLSWVLPTDSTLADDLLERVADVEDVAPRYGYKSASGANGVTVLRDGREDQGILLDVSGRGCRYLDSIESGWSDFLPAWPGHPTRIDLAQDFLNGSMPVEQIARAVELGQVRGKVRHFTLMHSGKPGDLCGYTVYAGSPSSERRARIYDKGVKEGTHPAGEWVRVELQLRRRFAAGVVDGLGSGNSLRQLWARNLRQMFDVCEPSDDAKRSRWHVREWWAEAVGDLGEGFTLEHVPETDLEHRKRWIEESVAATLYDCKRQLGPEWLQSVFNEGRKKLHKKRRA